jgi:pyruvate/2-oxoglutarate dehydrogenase complex dihydrolipoamide acyltransferase (E2) component
VDCKVDSVMNLRQKFKNEGIKFSINDIIIKAVATALDLCPDVNVIWKGDQVCEYIPESLLPLY